MNIISYVKAGILAAGTILLSILGGFDSQLKIMCIMMVIDWALGTIGAAWFQSSNKSDSGGLSSSAGYNGIVKKLLMLLYVAIASTLDGFMGTAFIRSGVIMFFLINELVSITENITAMGVPVPSVISNALDSLKERTK